jgi:hypothetical protein
VTTVRTISVSGLLPSRRFISSTDKSSLGTCKTSFHVFITRGLGISVIGTKLCGRRDLPQSRCGCGPFGTKRNVSDKYRRLRKRSLPLYANYVLDNHQKLFSAALRQFGLWRKALVAVGIEIPTYAWSRLRILRALDDALHEHSGKNIPEPLKSLRSGAVINSSDWPLTSKHYDFVPLSFLYLLIFDHPIMARFAAPRLLSSFAQRSRRPAIS